MRRLRHLAVLLRELWGYANRHRAWWIIPMVLVLLMFSWLISVALVVTPRIYALF